MYKKLLAVFAVLIGFSIVPVFGSASAQTTPTTETQTVIQGTNIYVAIVLDAREITDYSRENLSNRQEVELSIDTKDQGDQKRDATFIFPNEQFKKPLKRGDSVLIESTNDLAPGSAIIFISYYRQNNLLIWTILLFGLFLIVSGFKNNIKYLQIFFIFLASGVIVLTLYRNNTYLTFGLLFGWQILATYLFAYRIFTKKIPSTILTVSVFLNQILAMIIAFIMSNIQIFDIGLFDLFFPAISDAREVMMYIFAVMITYPITVVIAEQVISESIKKKREDSEITKIDLMKYLSRTTLKLVNYLFLTFFGLFFSIFVGVVAIASKEGIFLEAANSSFLTQVLSIGFLMLFNLIIFIPLISAITGLILGRFETHELVTDRNLKQLEL